MPLTLTSWSANFGTRGSPTHDPSQDFIFTDPTGTIGPRANYPLNAWVDLKAEKTKEEVSDNACLGKDAKDFSVIVADMHDGDEKKVTLSISEGLVTIEPHGNNQAIPCPRTRLKQPCELLQHSLTVP